MDIREFQPFGTSHVCALTATVGIAVWLVSLQRSPVVSERWKRGTALTLAALLFLAVVADPVCAWWRFCGDPVVAARIVHENSWPFYFCDIASLLCSVALIWRNQRVAELAYLWGVAGTSQGLITPNLYFEWWQPEFWGFFIEHGGVPVAGLMLAFGMGLPPAAGAVRRATLWGILYLVGAGLANWLISLCFVGTHPNYGFVRAKPDVGSLFDYFGPWPWYLLTLLCIAIVVFHLLCLPWRSRKTPEFK
ncbi:MAG: TIGR02206 family membrane protein [Verrucomicrobiota bacterium]